MKNISSPSASEMTRPRFLPLVASVFFALLVAACGSSGTSASLDGSEYLSTAVLENGSAKALVPGTRISLRFDGDQIGVSAGCNSMGGQYNVSDDVLAVVDLFMTEMGCDSERQAQDQFLADVLTSSPTVTVAGDALQLSTSAITIEFLERSVADPARPLVGTDWVITGFQDPAVAMSFPIDTPGTMLFGLDGTVSGFDGCADFVGSFESSGADITFGPITRPNPVECGTSQQYVNAFDRLFATEGRASFSVTSANLTLLNSSGAGITLVTSSR